jgi:hypothetical protein
MLAAADAPPVTTRELAARHTRIAASGASAGYRGFGVTFACTCHVHALARRDTCAEVRHRVATTHGGQGCVGTGAGCRAGRAHTDSGRTRGFLAVLGVAPTVAVVVTGGDVHSAAATAGIDAAAATRAAAATGATRWVDAAAAAGATRRVDAAAAAGATRRVDAAAAAGATRWVVATAAGLVWRACFVGAAADPSSAVGFASIAVRRTAACSALARLTAGTAAARVSRCGLAARTTDTTASAALCGVACTRAAGRSSPAPACTRAGRAGGGEPARRGPRVTEKVAIAAGTSRPSSGAGDAPKYREPRCEDGTTHAHARVARGHAAKTESTPPVRLHPTRAARERAPRFSIGCNATSGCTTSEFRPCARRNRAHLLPRSDSKRQSIHFVRG